MEDFRSSTPVSASGSANAQMPTVPKLPFGHCLVNPRWRKDAAVMMSEIQKYFTVMYSDEFDYVDFIPSSSHLVSVLTEEEIKENSEQNENVRRKLARLYKLREKNNNSTPLVVYQLSELTQPSFFKIQTLCVLDFHMAVYPVSNLGQTIPGLLERIKVAAKVPNPFKADRTAGGAQSSGTGKDQLLVLMGVQGIKEIHARKLLGKFGSLRGVMMAKPADISSVVGDRLSRALESFLDRNNSL